MFLLLLLTLPASLASPPASGAGAGAARSLEAGRWAPGGLLKSPPLPTCSTIHGERCVFPFTYLGTIYRECTDVDSPTGPWCATSVSRVGTAVDWGDCQASSCHLFTPTLPPPWHTGALCECINPFQGTSRWYKGDKDHLCPDKGLCYVACDGGCSDQAPTSNAHRCQSALACDVNSGFVLEKAPTMGF